MDSVGGGGAEGCGGVAGAVAADGGLEGGAGAAPLLLAPSAEGGGEAALAVPGRVQGLQGAAEGGGAALLGGGPLEDAGGGGVGGEGGGVGPDEVLELAPVLVGGGGAGVGGSAGCVLESPQAARCQAVLRVCSLLPPHLQSTVQLNSAPHNEEG